MATRRVTRNVVVVVDNPDVTTTDGLRDTLTNAAAALLNASQSLPQAQHDLATTNIEPTPDVEGGNAEIGSHKRKSEEAPQISGKKKRGRPKKTENAQRKIPAATTKIPTPAADDPEVEDLKEAKSVDKEQSEDGGDVCPVCLDAPVHPVKLPCRHVYCFLCAKGLAEANFLSAGGGSCSLCRQPVGRDFFANQSLKMDADAGKAAHEMCWFYEGRNGWWMFEERNNADIEAAFATGAASADLLICGHIYRIDFANRQQRRLDAAGRIRRIKRDARAGPSKGVAGLAKSIAL